MIKSKVSILLVHYNSEKELLRCIKSIYDNTTVSFEIIVWNNGKANINRLLKKKYSKIFYKKSIKNIGYGAGNNAAAKYASSEYLLILNPDTQVQKHSIDNLVSFLDKHRNVGIVAPNLITKEGVLFDSIGTGKLSPISAIFGLSLLNKLLPGNRISRKYWLKDLPKSKVREVDNIPGTAFLIRKNLFAKVGGFDENFFMYFEESDLCKRIKSLGYNIYILPESRVIHHWNSKEGGVKRQAIFEKSKFYYFKKHYGLASAYLVQFVTNISKWHLALVGILILATVLRLLWLVNNFDFNGDFAWYFMQFKDSFTNRIIPLVGMPSSVPILRQGAVWSWLLDVSLLIGGFNPLYSLIFPLLFNIISLVFVFLTVKEIISRLTALALCLFLATSPLVVYYSRLPFQTALIFPITVFIFWFALRTLSRNTIYHYFWLGFFIALSHQIYTGLILFNLTLLVCMIIVVMCHKYYKKLFYLNAGVAVGITPLIIWDLTQGVAIQTVGFIGWFVTKGFELITSQHFSSLPNLTLLTISAQNFFIPLYPVVSIALICISLFGIISSFKVIKTAFNKSFLCFWLISTLISLLIHDANDQAMYPILFFPIALYLVLAIKVMIKSEVVLLYVFLAMSILNIVYFFTIRGTFVQSTKLKYKTDLAITKNIIKDIGTDKFDFRIISPTSMFEANDMNFRYLFWWLADKEIDRNSILKYRLYETGENTDKNYIFVKNYGYAMLYKKFEN